MQCAIKVMGVEPGSLISIPGRIWPTHQWEWLWDPFNGQSECRSHGCNQTRRSAVPVYPLPRQSSFTATYM